MPLFRTSRRNRAVQLLACATRQGLLSQKGPVGSSEPQEAEEGAGGQWGEVGPGDADRRRACSELVHERSAVQASQLASDELFALRKASRFFQLHPLHDAKSFVASVGDGGDRPETLLAGGGGHEGHQPLAAAEVAAFVTLRWWVRGSTKFAERTEVELNAGNASLQGKHCPCRSGASARTSSSTANDDDDDYNNNKLSSKRACKRAYGSKRLHHQQRPRAQYEWHARKYWSLLR